MTERFTLTLQERSVKGNKVRKLRREGNIPCVVYGFEIKEPRLAQIEYNEFVQMFKNAGYTNVVDVTINDSTYHCLVHDIDVDPVRDTPRHVDFLAVNLKQKVEVEVEIEFVGKAPGVALGGVLNEAIQSVLVSALPDKVPEKVIVDISGLADIGSHILVSDIPTNKDYEILTEKDLTVVSIVPPEKEEPAPVTEAPTEGEVAAATPTTDEATGIQTTTEESK